VISLSLHNQKVGFMGQNRAKHHLTEKGYAIVAENFRCRMGEIDLIATIKNVLVFIEVKTDLTGYFGEAEARVDLRKQRRIKRAALFFLTDNKSRYHRDWEYRFDVIVVEKERCQDPNNLSDFQYKKNHNGQSEHYDLCIRHIKNAF